MARMNDRMLIAVDKYINGMYIELIPKYSWTKAMTDAKYAESTVNDRCADVWKRAKPFIQKRLDEILPSFEYTLEWIDEQFRDLYAECREKSDRVNASRVLEALAKRKAGFTDKIQGLNDSNQPLLTEQELAEYRLITKNLMKRRA